MSGFSAEWLALREAADAAARNGELQARVAATVAKRECLSIVDLACGAGSNLRALAPFLASRQHWRLVDHNPALLRAARARIADWADAVESDTPFVAIKDARRLSIEFCEADLSEGAEAAMAGDIDLVASAAFFDLVSQKWIERFAEALAARRLPLYAALNYDGAERRAPPAPQDAAMLRAFHAHQARDKGFGPAAGPRAATLLQEALATRGYRVALAPSPWRLGAGDAALMQALDDGAAQAARETGLIAAAEIDAWRAAPRAHCEIGHIDLFAEP
jgi:hypothetical protein